MKIGIVTTWFERGAAYVSKQFEEAFSKEHEVFIYARGGEKYAIGDPKWDKENVTWGKRNIFSTPTQINIQHLKEWIETNNIEVILFNEQHEWEPVIACSELDVITGAYIDYYKEETVPLFGVYDFLICNTETHHSVFKWHKQAFYVPWGTDTQIFKPTGTGTVNKDFVTFFHSCGMNPLRKGTDLLLDAFEKVNRKNAKLIIHSQIELGSFFPDKIDLLRRFEEEGSLEIIQKTVTAPGLYHMGDVYVYPTRLEGIGLTIAEAISCGLPAIVTNQQPMNEFVATEDAGKLVEVANEEKRGDNYYWPQSIVSIESLAQQMEFYIHNMENTPQSKGKARKYAQENLDWEKSSNELLHSIPKFKKLPLSEKMTVIDSAKAYENKRRISNKLHNSRLSILMKKLYKEKL